MRLRLWLAAASNVADEVMTPSPQDERGYWAGAIAAGHIFIGRAIEDHLNRWLGVLFHSEMMPWGGVIIAVLYWMVKETSDLQRGGDPIDGLTDGFFVGLGACGIPADLAAILVAIEAIKKETAWILRIR